MENNSLKNNELISGISILAVLKYAYTMEISKCLLIEPLLSYTRVLQVLKRTNSNIKSIENLIIKESIVFANFSSRYQDKLLLSVNSIILFEKLGLIKINDGKVQFTGEKFNFSNPTLGGKAKDRIAAAKRLADILMKGDASELYLSLRVEI
ncbi:MAG: hypothetical protein FNP40_15970 [Dehalobacter sp. 4CP]|uniref:hypothetical protein n=1 Tax=Dehalobacter sp. CP TaxID=2594474 RepID=UPI0013C64AC0|nr:hypothetical protein [Dehalobacter sp. 4CP]